MNCTLRRYLLSVFLLFVYLPTSATADELRDAVQAYNSKDYQTAYRIWRPLAEKGNALAQKCLGRMYEMGRGVPMDMVDAASWYRKAAEQGNPFAQLMLGLMARKGLGTPQDAKEAMKWLRLVADTYYLPNRDYKLANGKTFRQPENAFYTGNNFARFLVATMYINGEGVEQNYEEAAKWLQAIIDMNDFDGSLDMQILFHSEMAVGYQDMDGFGAWYGKTLHEEFPVALRLLGQMYAYGRGVPRDLMNAAPLLGRAAELNDVEAQYEYGSYLAQTKDLASAYFRLSLAAEARFRDAATKRDEVVSRMLPFQLVSGNALLDGWHNAHRK